MSSSDLWTSDSSAYLRPHAQADAWTIETAARGKVGGQRLLSVETTTPPADVRDDLKLPAGHQAVRRLRLIELDGHPVEIAESWYPDEIARGTGLAESTKIRGGAPTLLAGLGHPISAVVEDVESRLPTPVEAELLQMKHREPVLVLRRIACDSEERPIELSVMVTPGSHRRLRYEMKVN